MKQSLASARRLLEVLIHIISWGIVLGFPFFFTDRAGNSINWSAYLRHSAIPISFATVFYLNYFLPVPFLLFREQKNKYIIYNILLVCITGPLLHIWQSLDAPVPPIKKPHMPPGQIFFVWNILSLIFTIDLSAAIRMNARWGEAEATRCEAEKSRTGAELKNLHNQLNPHFLLNMLNNVYALIAFDSDKAQQAAQELSKLLRYVLYDNQQNYVPLYKEVDFIRNYIELMCIHLSGNVEAITQFDTQPDSQTKIAPLIFASLIENAFKHGISPTEPSFIHTLISENKEEIRCEIRNSCHPKTNMDKSGLGIGFEQVSKRPELSYSGHHRWDKAISEDGKEYISKLLIFNHLQP